MVRTKQTARKSTGRMFISSSGKSGHHVVEDIQFQLEKKNAKKNDDPPETDDTPEKKSVNNNDLEEQQKTDESNSTTNTNTNNVNNNNNTTTNNNIDEKLNSEKESPILEKKSKVESDLKADSANSPHWEEEPDLLETGQSKGSSPPAKVRRPRRVLR